MPLEQNYTIFRTEQILRRTENGLEPGTLVSSYPGFGASPRRALDEVMEDIAENESDLLSTLPMTDPDWDHELMRAVESLEGTWEVFSGTHARRPKGISALHKE